EHGATMALHSMVGFGLSAAGAWIMGIANHGRITMRRWLIGLLAASAIATITLPIVEYALETSAAFARRGDKAGHCYKNGKWQKCNLAGANSGYCPVGTCAMNGGRHAANVKHCKKENCRHP